MEPLILHIESSSKLCSVCLSRGASVIVSSESVDQNDHSATLVPQIQELLRSSDLLVSDLKAIAVSIGPGSYTGLRVGLSTAKSLCYALDIPLIAVDTLKSIAWAARAKWPDTHNIYIPVLDARRQDAYFAVFGSEGERVGEDRFVTVDPECLDFLDNESGSVLICGEGVEKWSLFSNKAGISIILLPCNAQNLVLAAWDCFQKSEFADLHSSVPNYLKPPNITIPL